jgi:hypothetical protein
MERYYDFNVWSAREFVAARSWGCPVQALLGRGFSLALPWTQSLQALNFPILGFWKAWSWRCESVAPPLPTARPFLADTNPLDLGTERQTII